MEKHLLIKSNRRNGGMPSRLGKRFHEKVEKIKDARLKNGKDKERISTEKVTNLIARHNHWNEIEEHIINAEEEEVNEYGHG